ncbi:MAG TPA: DNA polymerase III subunit delta [Geobacteraceae bacterium]|nr:DNA polymerase III subunit delta [Geobacteraceae bacterium]
MKAEDFSKAIDKGDIRPLYYLYGEETFLSERAAKRLLARLVTDDLRDFNLNVYYGNESSGDEIAATAQTLPMFAEWRAVLVKNADKLSAASLEVLAAYAQDPSPSTCLIFQGEKIDQRKKFFTELKKKGELVEFKRLYENQLNPFIRGEVASVGKKLQPAAAEMLLYLSGNNLQELVSQIEKTAIYVGKRDTIEVADIRAVVSDTRVDSVFELANSLGEKNLGKALRNLHALLGDGEAPLLILAVLARHFRQIWKVRELLEKKTQPQEIGRIAGVNPYFLQGVVRQAKNYAVPQLKRIFEKFFELDFALKSSGGKPAMLMERFVIEVCDGPDVKKQKKELR